MVRLEQEGFLTRLQDLYHETRESGSVVITLKGVTPADLRVDEAALAKKPPTASPRALDAVAKSPVCLVRAVATGGTRKDSKLASKKGKKGQKVKISTLVTGEDQEKFHQSLAALNKSQMDALKKRFKKKKKKTKAAAAAN
mmetsp:Transcript_19902/g.35368  ORF Transcript_19902/g.35368 Transcript_19902/m.35368 type:complete len:141 (+) Transcript_19902:50-472(+)